MSSQMKTGSFTELKRYELKYHIPMTWLPKLESLLTPWCSLDKHSELSPTGFYWVTSLYFDSYKRTFFNWKNEQLADRFNMRVRTYGKNPDKKGKQFLEVKRKRGDLVTKSRGILPWNQVEPYLSGAYNPDEETKGLSAFKVRAWQYGAYPQLLTQYRRKAWFGISEEYARVTVDTELRWRLEDGYNFCVDDSDMIPTDLPDYFEPGTNAVLELKCTKSEVPWWMIDIIRELNLQRRSFSKYGSAVLESMRLPGYRSAI